MAARTRASSRVVAAAVAATTLLGVGARAAVAHDVLVSTDPVGRSTVATAPAEVVLTFDQPAIALGSQVVVNAPGGATVSAGEPVLVNTAVTEQLAGDLPAGQYAVRWRITSADGHPVSGQFTYTAAAAGTDSTPRATGAGTTAAPTADRAGTRGGGPGSPLLWTAATAALAAVLAAVIVVHRRRRASASRSSPAR